MHEAVRSLGLRARRRFISGRHATSKDAPSGGNMGTGAHACPACVPGAVLFLYLVWKIQVADEFAIGSVMADRSLGCHYKHHTSSTRRRRQLYAPVMTTEDDTGGGLVRPKDAAISCSHLWAYLLLVSGLAGFVMGAILFSEWKGIGSFWVGAMAVAAGISGIYVTQAEAYGGMATGFYFFLSVITLAASLVSVVLGEGAAFLVVSKTDGNCFDGDDCPTDFCASEACVCWEPDGTEICEEAGSVRHCLRYGGDSCGDIGDSEGLLLGSSIVLLMIALFSFSSLLVAASTCFSCKRTIIVDSIENADAYG